MIILLIIYVECRDYRMVTGGRILTLNPAMFKVHISGSMKIFAGQVCCMTWNHPLSPERLFAVPPSIKNLPIRISLGVLWLFSFAPLRMIHAVGTLIGEMAFPVLPVKTPHHRDQSPALFPCPFRQGHQTPCQIPLSCHSDRVFIDILGMVGAGKTIGSHFYIQKQGNS